MGTRGLEVVDLGDGRSRIDAYFEHPLPPEVEDLGLEGWAALGAVLESRERVEATDWLAGYRAWAKPFRIGRHLVLDPRDPSETTPDIEDGHELLRIPARNAFGTGTHQSTRLAVELLEDAGVTDRSVLDVGTGTGILCLVALRVGAARAVGFDVDPVAAFTARENAALNNADRTTWLAGPIGCLQPTTPYDLIVVNIVPSNWLSEVGEVVALLADDGDLIVSGLLIGDVEEVCAELARYELRESGRREEGEWVALRLRR